MEAARSANERRRLAAQKAAAEGSSGADLAETMYQVEEEAARAVVAARFAGGAGLAERRVAGREKAGLGGDLGVDPAAAASGSGCWP
jgi:hypothetical protein